PPPPAPYTLSLHDALPISARPPRSVNICSRIWFSLIAQLATDGPDSFRNSVFSAPNGAAPASRERSSDFVTTLCTFVQAFCSERSEEHTSELQSRENLVCR